MSKYNKCINTILFRHMEAPEEEWMLTMNMGIDEVRMLYDHICYSIKMWPGAPARPAEEQEYLQILKNRLFAMIMEHTLDTK